jgi:hypothetical protein
MLSLTEVGSATIVTFENPSEEEQYLIDALYAYKNGHEVKLEMELPDLPDEKSIYHFNTKTTKKELSRQMSRRTARIGDDGLPL